MAGLPGKPFIVTPSSPLPPYVTLPDIVYTLVKTAKPQWGFYGRVGVIRNKGVLQENGIITLEARCMIDALADQIELALATRRKCHSASLILCAIWPEMRSLQQLGTRLEKATPASLPSLKAKFVFSHHFWQLVKDALTHYWGGQELSDSPLLGLRTVQRFLNSQGAPRLGTSSRFAPSD